MAVAGIPDTRVRDARAGPWRPLRDEHGVRNQEVAVGIDLRAVLEALNVEHPRGVAGDALLGADALNAAEDGVRSAGEHVVQEVLVQDASVGVAMIQRLEITEDQGRPASESSRFLVRGPPARGGRPGRW